MTIPEPDSTMPAPTPAWMPSRKTLLVAAIAFGIGLLLFVALWIDQRDSTSFYRTLEAPRSVAGQVFDPLPVPLPAGENGDNASGMGQPDETPAGGAQSPNRIATPIGPPVSPAPPVAAPAAPAMADRSIPQPVRSPAPRYPREAQRRGESGTVLVRVHVGADGEPTGVDLVEGSGSRSLDRAAVDAVGRWRFDPAIQGGRPVAGVIQVPITFNLER
jgi:protein TonB